MEGIIKCVICGSKKSKLIKKGVYGNKDQNIYKCSDCNHYFLAPFLSDEEEEKFYINDYPAFLLKRGDFKNITPEEHFRKNKSEAERRFPYIKHLLSKKKTVLEIGSATGYFLNFIKKYVNKVSGIEPNKCQREYANAQHIPTFDKLDNLVKKRFDLIFMYYVLEHIKDPISFIRDIKGLLKNKRSKLIIEVPNIKEALISFYKSSAYNNFMWQRAHCSYFSIEVLKKLYSHLGLRADLKILQRYDISNHIYWMVEGKPGGSGKFTNIFPEKINKMYKECLERAGIGDSILSIVSLL